MQLWEVEGGVACLVPMAMDKLFNSEKHAAAARAGPGNKTIYRVLPQCMKLLASFPVPRPAFRIAVRRKAGRGTGNKGHL